MCGKIEKLSDQNKNWCGSIYGPCDYDSGNKKTKRQKDKKAKRHKKYKNTKKTKKQNRQKDKKDNKQKKDRGPKVNYNILLHGYLESQDDLIS